MIPRDGTTAKNIPSEFEFLSASGQSDLCTCGLSLDLVLVTQFT